MWRAYCVAWSRDSSRYCTGTRAVRPDECTRLLPGRLRPRRTHTARHTARCAASCPPPPHGVRPVPAARAPLARRSQVQAPSVSPMFRKFKGDFPNLEFICRGPFWQSVHIVHNIIWWSLHLRTSVLGLRFALASLPPPSGAARGEVGSNFDWAVYGFAATAAGRWRHDPCVLRSGHAQPCSACGGCAAGRSAVAREMT